MVLFVTLAVMDSSLDETVSKFALSAPSAVKDLLESKIREINREYHISWKGNKGTIQKQNGLERGVDLNLFLSWIERSFGPLEHMSCGHSGNATYCRYVFRRRPRNDSSASV